MRRDGGNKPQFPIIRKRDFWAWRTNNPDRIESPDEISIYAHSIWQRKSPMSEAIDGKIEQILPVGRISNAQRSIAESGLRSGIPLLCPNLRPLSAACGHGRTCWRPDAVANDPLQIWSVFQPWLVADGGEDSVGAASRRASFRLERLPPQSPAIALPRRG
jgi:hypothetical protein